MTWQAELPKTGRYEIFTYAEKMPFRGRRRGTDIVKAFHYRIYHDDGIEEVEWNPATADGWNYLGTFYFSAGTAKIELTNKSQGRIVVADAVKWVKK